MHISLSGNACPACYSRIASQSDCTTVGQNNAGSIGWEGTETNNAWPAGCYHCNDVDECSDGTWWNKHASGAANAGARPWCVKTDGGGVGDGTSDPCAAAVDGVILTAAGEFFSLRHPALL